MILNALVERLKRRSKGDFKGRHFEGWGTVGLVLGLPLDGRTQGKGPAVTSRAFGSSREPLGSGLG